MNFPKYHVTTVTTLCLVVPAIGLLVGVGWLVLHSRARYLRWQRLMDAKYDPTYGIRLTRPRVY